MKRAVIVVHVYKESLSESERISLLQLNRILSDYPVWITCPQGMDVSSYREILKGQLKEVRFFPVHYFLNLRGYNRLMMHPDYYKEFLEFDYMLIHHTDAFVFRDELSMWMDKGYDFIGAPVYDYDGTMNPTQYVCCGNGGLSLRKVKTFHSISAAYTSVYRYRDVLEDVKKYNWKGRLYRSLYYVDMLLTLGSRIHPGLNRIRLNEDVIWGLYIARYITNFEVASFKDSLQFSMEFNCDELMRQNNGALPFGCHGWSRELFINFWRPYIEASINQ